MADKTLKFIAPYALGLSEARSFGRICRDLHGRIGEVSAETAALAADYVTAASRLARLHILLDLAARKGPDEGGDRLLALARQIDGTTDLRMRLAKRLGLR